MNFHLATWFLVVAFITNCGGLPADKLQAHRDPLSQRSQLTAASRRAESAQELAGRYTSKKRSFISGLLGNITSQFDDAAKDQIIQQVSNIFAGNKSLTDVIPALEAMGLAAKTDTGS